MPLSVVRRPSSFGGETAVFPNSIRRPSSVVRRLFAYDASGQRVKTVEPAGKTTYFPFPNYEETVVGGSTTRRSSYMLAGQVVAFRVATTPTASGNDGLFFSYGDHLGSTSVLQKSSDTQPVTGSWTRYRPYGSYRTTPTQTLTDRDFTGQRENREIGLLYFNARFYHPASGRFISPDTIVPDPVNPQQLNRYTYSLNSPLNYSDPTGHCAETGDDGCWSWYDRAMQLCPECRELAWEQYGMAFQREKYYEVKDGWKPPVKQQHIAVPSKGLNESEAFGSAALILDSLEYAEKKFGIQLLSEKVSKSAPYIGPALAGSSEAYKYINEGHSGIGPFTPGATGFISGVAKDSAIDYLSGTVGDATATAILAAGGSATLSSGVGFGVWLGCQLGCEAAFNAHVEANTQRLEMINDMNIESPIIKAWMLNATASGW